MSSQKALVVTKIAQPLSLTNSQPVVQPGPNQLQLRITVAGLNPHDEKARDTGLFISDYLPAVLANDVAGIVSALGPNVTKFKVGDRVFTQANLGGNSQTGLQQYSIADIDYTSKIPEGFTDDDAATLPINVIAPLVGFFDKSALGIPAPWTAEAKTFDYQGTSILIIGGGSNCGRFAVQLAKLAGIGTVVTVGGNEEELKKFGATHVLDRHGGDEAVLQRIRSVLGDELVYILDAVNEPEGQIMGLNALSSKKKGKFARLVPLPVDESKIVGKNAGYELKNVFGSSHVKAEVCRPFWDRLAGYMEQGKIVPLGYTVVKGLDAAKVNEVLDGYRDGKKVSKTHIHVSE